MYTRYVLGEELYKYLCFRSNAIICILSLIICIVKEFEIMMFKPICSFILEKRRGRVGRATRV